MTSLSSDIPLIDKAKKRATDIVSAYKETDRFQVLTHNFSGITSKILTKEDALDAIENVEVTPKVKSLNTILQKQIETYKLEQGEKSFFLISDFQRSIFDIEPKTDTTFNLSLVPLNAVLEQNISIDSAYFTTPIALLNQKNALVVSLTNYSNEDQTDIILSVLENGQKKPAGSLSIKANSSKTDTVNLTFLEDGDKNITLQVQDYPVQFDDNYYVTTSIATQTEVLSIYDDGSDKFIRALFGGISEINLSQQNLSNLDYSKFSNYDMIILEDLQNISTGLASELIQYINKGGNVLCFPAKNASTSTYNAFFSQLNTPSIVQWQDGENSVYNINTDEFIFNKVYTKQSSNADLPKVTGSYSFTKSASQQGETLLAFRNGEAFVNKYKRGSGHLYICKSPLDRKYNQLVEYAEVFVPMIYKMTFAKGSKDPIAYSIGNSNQISVTNAGLKVESIYSISGEEGEFIPQQQNIGSQTQIVVKDEITQAGFYTIKNDNQAVKSLAFNYDRIESDPKSWSIEDLRSRLGETVTIYDNQESTEFLSSLKEKEEGIFLWKWCLIAALIFLAIETLLLRLWK
jgi:hypothetical protein